jgi:hypothetical protein
MPTETLRFQWTLMIRRWHTVHTFRQRISPTVNQSLVILGAGYTARFLLPLATCLYSRVLATSREPEKKLSHVQPDRRIRFDLTQPDTWKNIPPQTDLLWCFPAAPPDLVQRFAATLELQSRKLVVLGSTSAYETGEATDYPPAWIDETALLDLTQPRVEGEEFLRITCQAIVLRVSGIYGPGRNPLDWIRNGRVGPSRKYVNLVHVEDLAAICLAALERGKPREAYNVSDGFPRTWKDICDTARERWNLQAISKPDDQATGKRIANSKLTNELGVTIQRADLYTELDLLNT